MARKSGVALLLGLVLAGCGSSRPTASPPVLDCGLERFVVADIFSGWHGFDRGQRSAAQGAAAAQRPLNVLALSAGGELGVFGAGFLRGWREAGAAAQPVDRGDIQIVTGVSAGALLATHAFLGKDVFLHEILPDIGRDALFSTRTLSLLWANALLDDAGKDKSQRDDVLQDEVISEVAVETKPGHFLYIGVTDLDSGRFLQIDMVRLARELQPLAHRNECYRAVIGASTAIPVLMSPKFVDGMMLSDGALRQHLFAPAVPRETFGAGAQRRLIAVVNQDLVTEAPGACSREPGKVCNGVLPIASRVAGLAADQGLKDSLRAIESLARRPAGDGGPERLFETFYATAAEAVQACAEIRQQNCPPDSAGGSGGFCRVYMRCVADQGRVQGSHASGGNLPWRTFDALGIGSLPP